MSVLADKPVFVTFRAAGRRRNMSAVVSPAADEEPLMTVRTISMIIDPSDHDTKMRVA